MTDKNKEQVSSFETFDWIVEEIFDPVLYPEKRFAVYDPSEDKAFYRDEIELENGKVLVPNQSSLIDNKVVLLPSEVGSYIDTANLISEIKQFVHRYVDIHPFYEDLVVHYVLMSWVFDKVSVVPYLRAFADYGSGKTRFIQVVGSICYKPCFIAGSLTTSPIFRMIESFGGTMVINELDLMDKNTDLYSDLVKILNNGFEKGMVVLRTEGEKVRDVKAYKTFSPKIFSTRKRFKDQALESRIITIPMQMTKRKDIPVLIPYNFWEEAQALRNKLLLFRFRKLREPVFEDKTEKLANIEPRLKQTLLPLFSLIEDPKLEEQVLSFARNYQKQLIQDRGLEIEGLVAGKLVELLKLNERISVKDVTEKVNQELEDSKYKLTPQKVGKVIREDLGFKTERSGATGAYQIIQNPERLAYISQRFGLESSESSVGSEVASDSEPNLLKLLNFYTPTEEAIKDDLVNRISSKEELTIYTELMGEVEMNTVRKILIKEDLKQTLEWFDQIKGAKNVINQTVGS